MKRPRMKFVLEIELGNEGMNRSEDIAERLEIVAFNLRELSTIGFIRDRNGNTVGEYKVVEET